MSMYTISNDNLDINVLDMTQGHLDISNRQMTVVKSQFLL